MKCDILFVLSLIVLYSRSVSHTFEEPVKKKGKMNKGVFSRTFVSYIS